MAAEERPNFTGRWEVYKQENFDAFLQALGANFVVQKMFSNYKPVVDIVQDGAHFIIKYISKVLSREEDFNIDEEYDQKEMMGAEFKVTATWEGNKLVQTYVPKTDEVKSRKTTRVLVNDEIILTQEVGDVVATRYFRRVETQ